LNGDAHSKDVALVALGERRALLPHAVLAMECSMSARRASDKPASVLVGLIGTGIQASLTPAMHEREASVLGLPYVYRLIDFDVLGLPAGKLSDVLASAEWMGFNGLNITYPCKQAVIPLLHDLSKEAAELGAVNTVLLRDGRRIGHNTDWWGFAEAFKRELPNVPLRHVLQLGAGGAGSAVAQALLTAGVQNLSIFDTDDLKARGLATALQSRFDRAHVAPVASPDAAIALVDGLVNTTPVGMTKLPGVPLRPELLRPDLWVADVIYFPHETELLRSARALGCRTMNGGGMAVFQAVEAFRLFTGRLADAERMQVHFAEMCAGTA
jgi:shikimate dehydrogenase